MRLDPARRMQTVPELMSALTDPGVANAMFERGETQVSTRKIMGASLVVIVVLALLLFWSLVRSDGQGSAVSAAPASTAPAVSQQKDPDVIPDLVGLRYATEIKESNLYVRYRIVMTEDYSSEVAQGCVIRQEPAAGTLPGENQIIQIVVSRGPHLVEMPNIIGYTQANASRLLDEKGIEYRMQMVDNDGSLAAGCVAKTDVTAGTRFDAGKTIVSVFIAGERDDSLVAETGGGEETLVYGDGETSQEEG